MLDEYGLTTTKISAVVTDNGSNMIAAFWQQVEQQQMMDDSVCE
jgi:hypothetical protein